MTRYQVVIPAMVVLIMLACCLACLVLGGVGTLLVADDSPRVANRPVFIATVPPLAAPGSPTPASPDEAEREPAAPVVPTAPPLAPAGSTPPDEPSPPTSAPVSPAEAEPGSEEPAVSESTSTSEPQPPTPTPTVPPIPPTPTPQTFTGRGQQWSPLFTLNDGLLVVEMKYEGESYFSVVLLDGQSRDQVELIAGTIGPFEGGKAVGVEVGDYLLNIGAEGNWTVRVGQPDPPAELAASPITLSGRGQQASEFFRLSAGPANFGIFHNGEHYFAIWLLDAGGHKIDLLVNQIGAFDGSYAVDIPQGGPYLLDIQADGDWSVTIEQ